MNKRANRYGMIQNEQDQLAKLLGQALLIPGPATDWMLQTIGSSSLRVVRVGGAVAAGLGIIAMGQWWGGRRVSVAGIVAVGVAPEHRGAGVGAELMREMLAEQRRSGTALSVLYASTLWFYRSVGYERAGSSIIYELPIEAIPSAGRELLIQRLDQAERELPRRLHDALGPLIPGRLDRPHYLWERIFNPPTPQVVAYAALRGDEPEGYLVLSASANRQDPLFVRDFCALTADAGRRLQQLLADHRSMLPAVSWRGTPNDPLLALLPEQAARVTQMSDWVLRIVDVQQALQTRGYSPGVGAELHLEVRDRVLPENAGRWIVRVADGAAEVERGGNGNITLDIRDLAAIYTGHASPIDRRYAGDLSGSDADLTLLGAVFAGPAPRMNDMF